MKRVLMAIILVTVIVGSLVAVRSFNNKTSMSTDSMNMSANTATTASAPNQVYIQNFAFNPVQQVVKKGTTVTWTNKDDAHHTIVITQGSLKGMESPLLAKGESYKLTFNETGIYTYQCGPHPYMKATIEVKE